MKTKIKKKSRGLTLIELLVVIGIIAVLASIAIPGIYGIFEEGMTNTAKRNAQTIASTSSVAVAAGVKFTDLDSAVNTITREAAVPTDGPFKGVPLSARLSEDEAARAKKYLGFNKGIITYNPNANK